MFLQVFVSLFLTEKSTIYMNSIFEQNTLHVNYLIYSI